MNFYKFRVNIVSLESVNAILAVLVVADIADKSRLQAQSGGGDGGVGAIANGWNYRNRLIRNFVGKIKTDLTIFFINIAIHRRFFNPNKSVYRRVAYGDKVKIIFEKHNNFILAQENFA